MPKKFAHNAARTITIHVHASILYGTAIFIKLKSNYNTFLHVQLFRNQESHVMRRSAFYTCENKGTDQLCGNCAADQRLCFRYIHVDSTIPPFSKSEFDDSTLVISCG